MGVPLFVRWLRQRYPRFVVPVVEHQYEEGELRDGTQPNPNGVEYDNLYLDMNGILHQAAGELTKIEGWTMEQIFDLIFCYIERLFLMIRPRKLLYLAIDGVAPRAKMNQQRGRRFMKHVEQREKSETARDWDSNCITPGTVFMKEAATALAYFCSMKTSTDPAWRNIKVILSDAGVPGEGEHKIMDFIRCQRTDPNYDPNMTHVVYSADADLVMLLLAVHEPKGFVLRELPPYSIADVDKEKGMMGIPFEFLDISVLRFYLNYEFLREDPPIDLERGIDDFVFLCCLVGNDFLPNLPTLRIREGALDTLMTLYKKHHQLEPGSYLTHNGTIIYRNFVWILSKLSKKEEAILQRRKKFLIREAKDEAFRKFLEKKNAIMQAIKIVDEQPTSSEKDWQEKMEQLSNAQSVLNDVDKHEEDDDLQSGTLFGDFVKLGTDGWRDRYYELKFKCQMTQEMVDTCVSHYLMGLAWVLQYYYNGNPSWEWFFPYHYAPFAYDISRLPKLASFSPKFHIASPFLPFAQLMAVLPPQSASLVPAKFQEKMISPDSEISDFYPIDFELDRDGKAEIWQAIPLLPWIDVGRLQRALEPLWKTLTSEETTRNTLSSEFLFSKNLQLENVSQSSQDTTFKLNGICGQVTPAKNYSEYLKQVPIIRNIPRLGNFKLNDTCQPVRFTLDPNFKLKIRHSLLPGAEDITLNFSEYEIENDVKRNLSFYNKAGLGVYNSRMALSDPSTIEKLDENSLGFRMLVKMGWTGGRLGLNHKGALAPIRTQIKLNNKGLGYDSDEEEVNDDAIEEIVEKTEKKLAENSKKFHALDTREIKDMLVNFKKSLEDGSRDPTSKLQFPPDLTAEQRAKVHTLCARMDLKSTSSGSEKKGTRCLTVRAKSIKVQVESQLEDASQLESQVENQLEDLEYEKMMEIESLETEKIMKSTMGTLGNDDMEIEGEIILHNPHEKFHRNSAEISSSTPIRQPLPLQSSQLFNLKEIKDPNEAKKNLEKALKLIEDRQSKIRKPKIEKKIVGHGFNAVPPPTSYAPAPYRRSRNFENRGNFRGNRGNFESRGSRGNFRGNRGGFQNSAWPNSSTIAWPKNSEVSVAVETVQVETKLNVGTVGRGRGGRGRGDRGSRGTFRGRGQPDAVPHRQTSDDRMTDVAPSHRSVTDQRPKNRGRGRGNRNSKGEAPQAPRIDLNVNLNDLN
eukprot:TRINITY_DN290_c0_g4_i2.p1 TRINITY_DN290_c0_g4~~TRINITY_DN290_c0_g4_i2.p1  ORF type:complete len:1192 (-),score=411.78 TRINITY_DN290_c0_g4_i2:75-3650(-)